MEAEPSTQPPFQKENFGSSGQNYPKTDIKVFSFYPILFNFLTLFQFLGKCRPSEVLTFSFNVSRGDVFCHKHPFTWFTQEKKLKQE